MSFKFCAQFCVNFWTVLSWKSQLFLQKLKQRSTHYWKTQTQINLILHIYPSLLPTIANLPSRTHCLNHFEFQANRKFTNICVCAKNRSPQRNKFFGDKFPHKKKKRKCLFMRGWRKWMNKKHIARNHSRHAIFHGEKCSVGGERSFHLR